MVHEALSPIRVHNKQFLLARDAYQAHPDWVCTNLDNGFVLSYCPNLRVSELQSRDGQTFYLLGHAVLTDRLGRSVEGDFHHHMADAIEDWTTSWTGRWVLIGPDWCQPDGCASLDLVCRSTGSGPDARFWVSSSASLLAEASAKYGRIDPVDWKLRRAHGIDWVPPPFTSYPGIMRVLPLNRVAYRRGVVEPLSVPSFADALVAGNPSVETFAERLRIAAYNLQLLDLPKIRTALTAGLDTRTVLSASVAAGVDVETFTVAAPWVVQHDVDLPPQLAAAVGTRHTIVVDRPLAGDATAQRLEQVRRHVGGNVVSGPFRNLAEGRLEFAQDPNALFVTGSAFEFGRCTYWPRFARGGATGRLPDVETVLRSFPNRERDMNLPWAEAIDHWLDSARRETFALDWRDRFFLDQRLGTWLANNHQVWDLVGGTSLPLVNSLSLYGLLLQPEVRRRKAFWLQQTAMATLEPRLASFPINPLPLPLVLWRKLRTEVFAQGRLVEARARRTLSHLGMHPS